VKEPHLTNREATSKVAKVRRMSDVVMGVSGTSISAFGQDGCKLLNLVFKYN
jgi:hypothetical protein